MNLRDVRSEWVVLVLAVAFGTLTLAGGGEKSVRHTSHEEAVKAWAEARVEKLLRPGGYLSIVGLHWLAEGRSSFGSDPTNDIVFPKKAPRFMGSFHLTNGVVSVDINENTRIEYEGQRVTSMKLRNDHDESGPTVLKHGTLSWYVIDRGGRIGIRVKDSESEGRLGFKGIDRFPVDEKWRFEAVLDRYEPVRLVPIETVVDVAVPERVIGAVVFAIGDTTYRLDAIIESHSPKLWIIFSDGTAGEETYGGGRFLYLDPPDEDGRMFVDFNIAENPPCAFSDYTTCPLPPEQNRMPIRITAGEKNYGKHGKTKKGR